MALSLATSRLCTQELPLALPADGVVEPIVTRT
jgi:hypothetical protein